jgi:uncharacterized membrane protein
VSRSLIASVENRLRNLRYSYLFTPAIVALAFAGLAVLMTSIDDVTGRGFSERTFPGGATAARNVLATIATSLATVAGVSFSITVLSLQLVSQQFTPRALRTFLGDRLNQVVAGIFIGVFLYCLVVMRSIPDDAPFEAGASVLLAMALAFVALGALLVFISNMGRSIQVSDISDRIGHGTLRSIGRLYPEEYGRPLRSEDAEELVRAWRGEREPALVFPERPGFVQALDDLPTTIEGDSFRVHVLVSPGDFVTEAHPLAAVWTDADAEECAVALRRGIAVTAERDLEQDTGYGIRQLADIAVKALSTSVNDPTTATTCIGYLQAILERLAQRAWPADVRRIDERDVTIVFRTTRFDEYTESFVQIGRYAQDARVVHALLRACLRVAEAAERVGADDRVEIVRAVAGRILARADDLDEAEREQMEETIRRLPAGQPASSPASA